MTTTITTTLALLAALQGPTQVPPPAEAAVFPAETFAFARFAGLAACRDAAARMAIPRLAERVGRQFDPDLMPPEVLRGVERLDRELGRLGVDRADLRSLLQGGFAIGVGRPTWFDDHPVPSVAVAFAVGEDHEAADRVLRALLGAAERRGADLSTAGEQVADVALTVVRPAGANRALCWASVGSHVVVSNSPGYLRDCVRAATGRRPSLAECGALQRGFARQGGGALLTALVRPEALLGTVGAVLPYEVTDVLAAAGIEGFEGMYLGVGERGTGSRDLLSIGLRTADGRGLRSIASGELLLRAASHCPADTLLYVGGGIDLQAAGELVGQVIDALPPAVGNQVRDKVERRLERRGAAAFVHELREVVGGEFAAAVVAPGGSGVVPATLLFLTVRDGERAERLIDGALERAGLECRTQEFEGHSLRFVDVAHEGIRMAPACAVLGDLVVLSNELRVLKETLRREPADSLAGAADFASLTGGHDGAVLFGALRIGPNFAKLWRLAEGPLEGLLAENEIPLDVLPTQEELRQMLGIAAGSISLDAHGIHLTADDNLGLGVALAAAGRYLDLVLAAPRGEAKEAEAPRRKRVH